jgi:hypothetical protein
LYCAPNCVGKYMNPKLLLRNIISLNARMFDKSGCLPYLTTDVCTPCSNCEHNQVKHQNVSPYIYNILLLVVSEQRRSWWRNKIPFAKILYTVAIIGIFKCHDISVCRFALHYSNNYYIQKLTTVQYMFLGLTNAQEAQTRYLPAHTCASACHLGLGFHLITRCA